MRRIFNTNFNHNTLDLAILILRVVLGVFMLSHGLGKFQMLVAGGTIKFADPIGIGELPSLILAVFAEVICSVLLILGFATRLVVIPLMVTMIVAVFVVHANDGFKVQELPAHYLLAYFFILLSGAGKYSVDYFISKKLNRRSRLR